MNIFNKAVSEFERLCTKELSLVTRRQQALTALASAKAAAGIALADDSEATAELEIIWRLNADIDAADHAIHLIRERRPAAIAAEQQKEADAIRAEAATKRRELGGLQAKTAKLWAQLSELEGAKLSGENVMVEGGLRSEALSHAADTLEAKALEVESAGIRAYGFVDLEDVTSDGMLIEAVLRHKSAGPSAEAVQEWLTSCADDQRVPGRAFDARPRRVRLEWAASKIDAMASYQFVPGLARKRSGVMNSTGATNPGESDYLLDIPSGTFQAAA